MLTSLKCMFDRRPFLPNRGGSGRQRGGLAAPGCHYDFMPLSMKQGANTLPHSPGVCNLYDLWAPSVRGVWGDEELPLRTSDLLRFSHPTEPQVQKALLSGSRASPKGTSLGLPPASVAPRSWGGAQQCRGSGSLCCLGTLLPCCWGCWCSRGLSARGSGDQWGSVRGLHVPRSPRLERGHRPAGGCCFTVGRAASCSSSLSSTSAHFHSHRPEPPGSF